MSHQLSATIFSSGSTAGLQLRDQLAEAIGRLGMRVNIARPDAKRHDLEFAILTDTIVIVDGTIEPENRLYEIASLAVLAADHVLVVGRTRLPVNFVGLRTGGSPDLRPPSQLDSVVEHLPFPNQEMSNDEIAMWVANEASDIMAEPGDRLELHEAAPLLAKAGRAYRALQVIRRRSEVARNKVFVSYRGPQYDRVRDTIGARIPEAVLIPPGALAYEAELMSEARRWTVLSRIEDELRGCREFWVYQDDAKGLPYLGSWWTAAELLAASYVRSRSDGPAVRVYDAVANELRQDEGFILETTDASERRFARFMSHCRPHLMAPEARARFQRRRKLYENPLSGAALWFVDGWQEVKVRYKLRQLVRDPAERAQIIADGARDSLRDYTFDRVHDEDFWSDLRIEEARLTSKEFEYPLDADAILLAPQQRMIRFSRGEVEDAVRHGAAVTSVDKKWRIQVREVHPRFMWHPTGIARRGLLERTPTFLAVMS